MDSNSCIVAVLVLYIRIHIGCLLVTIGEGDMSLYDLELDF